MSRGKSAPSSAEKLALVAPTIAGYFAGRAAVKAFSKAPHTNRAFIDAYMVGLNHEFARELLWREYPTDQRAGSFRQFWDTRRPPPEILLLDGLAVVADLIAFYSERPANEGYLRTATIRRSIMRLGQLVSYQPAPGARMRWKRCWEERR